MLNKCFKSKFVLTAKVVLLLIILVCFNLPIFAVKPEQTKAPYFRITSISSKRFDSRKKSGEVIVISFFYTSCPPCIKEMPELYAFMKKHKKLENLLFVDPWVKAMSIGKKPDSKHKVKKFTSKLKISDHNVYLDSIGTLTKNFSKKKIFKKARTLGSSVIFPTIIVINKKGHISYVQEGSDPEFLSKIEKLL